MRSPKRVERAFQDVREGSAVSITLDEAFRLLEKAYKTDLFSVAEVVAVEGIELETHRGDCDGFGHQTAGGSNCLL